jgi:hypothetical protein
MPDMCQHAYAFTFRDDRAVRAFASPDLLVTVHSYDQDVSIAFGLFQIEEMPDVNEVKSPHSKDYF